MKPYLLPLLIIWAIWALILMILGYEDSFLLLNSFHHPIGDAIMPHLTHLGDGATLVCILIIWKARKDPALVFTTIFGMLAVMLLVYVTKQLLFIDWQRPPLVFANRVDIHMLSVQNECCQSFPSGHSMAATTALAFFAMGLAAAKPWIRVGLGLLAALISYTRLYIGVHFLGDVLAGSMLGAMIAAASLVLLYKALYRRLQGGIPAWTSYILMLAALALMASNLLRLSAYYQ